MEETNYTEASLLISCDFKALTSVLYNTDIHIQRAGTGLHSHVMVAMCRLKSGGVQDC